MKRVFKIMLCLMVILSGVAVTTSMTATPVIAKTVGDYTYTDNNDGTVTITNYGGSEKDVVVPEELDGKMVSAIGYAAFAECRSLESLVVPETVTRLQDYAFSQCTSLTRAQLPESIVSLGRGVFKNCILLEEVNIPTSLTTVAMEMFAGCTSLTEIEIPQTIRSLGDSAFSGCSGLSEIVLPDNVTSLGSAAFRSCVNLERINLSPRLTTIGNNAFAECYELASIEFPQTLRQIGQSAFMNCISLTQITLPESITNLGYSAFTGCSSLTEINLPANLQSIPDSAFSACSSLQHIELPENITSVGASAFAACVSLEEITLPDSVTEIGSGIFSDCDSLVSVNLSEDIETIPSEAFRYCDNLHTVVVPSGVSEVGNNAFADCASLTAVFLPGSIARADFGSTVFYNSPNAVLYVLNGSGAYSYAINAGLNYVVLDDEITLQAGESREMVVMRRNYSVASNTDLTWESTNSEIASVENGVITAHRGGDAIISAETSTGARAEVSVHVDDEEKPITSITLNNTQMEMNINTRQGLRATITPSDTTDSKLLSWESEDPTIAIVSATGNVTAKGAGTTTITVSAENGVSASCEVTVKSPITAVRLSQTDMTLERGASQQLRTMIEPVDTTDDRTLSWSSSVPSVAMVDDEGNVTALSEGYAIIRVETSNGKTATCTVQVVETQEAPITGVSLDQENVTLAEGENTTLNATITPSDTTDDRTLIWSSDAPEVAVVNGGVVTAIAPGTATITVTTSNGLSDSCVITVEPKEIAIDSVSLDHSELTLKAGLSAELIATINPSDTTMSKALTWESSNADVAVVEDGVVKAIAQGDALISVTTVNGKRAECTVHVFEVALDALNETIDRAQGHAAEDYTASSYAQLSSALSKAIAVAEDINATQDDVDAAQQELEAAIGQLVQRADMSSIEKLTVMVDEARQQQENYTEAEFADMAQAIMNAEAILTKDVTEISEAEVTAAIAALDTADAALDVIDAQKALTEAIADAQAILDGDTSVYEPEGVEALRSAVSNAQALADAGSEDIEALNNAAAAVREAIGGLQLKEPEAEADKSFLQLFYDAVKDTTGNGYTSESYEAFAAALQQAADALNDEGASQAEVNAAADELIAAYSSLEREAQIDYSAIDFEIEFAQSMLANEAEYYASDMENVRAMVEEAQALRNANAAQDEVDQMVKAMRELRLSIRKRPQ